MGSCQLIKEHGSRCGSTNGVNCFYYKDGQNMWRGEREICQMDSQAVFGKLLAEEEKIKLRQERLQSLRKRIWNTEKRNDPEVKELERQITDELRLKNKLVSVNSPIQLQRQVNEAMQNEVFRRIKKMGEVLRDHRNKFCRLCLHELECTCDVCRHPQNPRHWGENISSVTVFSQKYYRRHTFNFHIICGRIFLARFGINLIPSLNKQLTLKQSLEDLL